MTQGNGFWRLCGLAAGLLLMATSGAQAQSLRCNDTGVREGDSRLWLLRTCGQPQLSDFYCVPLYYPGPPNRFGVSPPIAAGCLMTDEWLYERGPGNLVAVVKIQNGKIVSIRYGEQGR
ncbi:DUF2845 domain-containing protein [Roseateles sp. SL47]|uniref:DUF2845 domain-containing protein n=1 Tax=Roseateles sp. SL47 TaxID=2995138 RepID=UPI002271134C|nr:DUF2845 domain-containing protein [Roseateles sp. SL47]WAC75682.1 DUF2845 domain-containing protein [Roseateles sp. SL47]